MSLMKDTLGYDENSFKMCVCTVQKSENGRLFPNDKFYFNFSLDWTFNGKSQ